MTDNNRVSLFSDITDEEQKQMLSCFNTYERSYPVDSLICFYDDKDLGVGIVEKGQVRVMHNFPNGSKTILENLGEGDIFGQLFYSGAINETISVEAVTDCHIRFFDYEHIVKRCPRACAHHSRLVNNILMMMSDKARDTCEHLEVLSQRSIKDRLICFFEILAAKNGSRTFELPFTVSAMADYISVDRSAMSREMNKMRSLGLIDYEHRKITLLKESYDEE